MSETDWRHREIITALGLPFASPGFSQRRRRRQLCKIWRPCARAAAADLPCSAKHAFGGCDSATAYIGAGGHGVHRRESNAPRAHGRSVRRVAASDRKSDPERESGHGVKHSKRQPEGHRLVLGRAARGRLFLTLIPPALSFLQLAGRRSINGLYDRGRNDSRWSFYEPLAL